MRGLRRGGVLGVLLCAGACSSPVVSLANLEELHQEDPEAQRSPDGAAPRLRFAESIEHRGRCHRFWNEVRSMLFLDPKVEEREVSQPIKFAIYQLEVVGDHAGQFDEWQRVHAKLALAEIARRSPSRALQAQSLRQLRGMVDEDAAAGWSFETVASSEAEVDAAVGPLEQLVRAPAAAVAPMLEAERAGLEEAVRRLGQLRSLDVEVSDRLARIAVLAGRQVAGDPLDEALFDAAAAQVLRTLFATSLRGVAETSQMVQSQAIRLAFRLDASSASRLLAPAYQQLVQDPLVRRSMFEELASSGMDPAGLDPVFRRQLLIELHASEAALEYWSRAALRRLLDLSEDAGDAEITAAWAALGSWPEGAEGAEGA